MITDPRLYSTIYPKSNIVINVAQSVLDGQTAATELVNVLMNQLKEHHDELINVALNLAPNYELSHLIWQSLDQAINSPTHTAIFAIPIVFVLGSKTRVKLDSSLDSEGLNNFFQQQQIFNSNFEVFVSGRLIDPTTIAAIKPSQIYYWVRNLQHAKLWLPLELVPQAMEIQGEGVFVRFLIGVGTQPVENNQPVYCIEKFQQHAMELMHLVSSQLKNESVTMFVLPFAPVSLSSSFSVGKSKRVEIAISVALSNIIKKIRERGLIPQIKLSSVADAIRIEVICDDPDLYEASLWHLQKFDNLVQIYDVLTSLFDDMQVKWECC